MSLNEWIRRGHAGQSRRPTIVVALAITAIVLAACGSQRRGPDQGAGAPPPVKAGRNGSDTGAPVPVVGGVVDGSGSQSRSRRTSSPTPT